MSGLEVSFFIVFALSIIIAIFWDYGELLHSTEDIFLSVWGLCIVFFILGLGMFAYSNTVTASTVINSTPAKVLDVVDNGSSLKFYFVDEVGNGRSVEFLDIETYTKYKNGGTLNIEQHKKDLIFGPTINGYQYTVK